LLNVDGKGVSYLLPAVKYAEESYAVSAKFRSLPAWCYSINIQQSVALSKFWWTSGCNDKTTH